MADWNKPSLSDLYADFKQYLSDRLNDAAKMFNSATVTATNLPAGTIRWNSTSSKFEIWSGVEWGDLTSTYGISISGSSASCTGNADTVDTFHASQSVVNNAIVVRNSSGVIAGSISGSSASCSGNAENAGLLGGVAAASLSVNHANTAGSANYATSAGEASTANYATSAGSVSLPILGAVGTYVKGGLDANGTPWTPADLGYGGTWQTCGLAGPTSVLHRRIA